MAYYTLKNNKNSGIKIIYWHNYFGFFIGVYVYTNYYKLTLSGKENQMKIRKFKLISEKIQIFQKKGRHLFLYVVPNAKSL